VSFFGELRRRNVFRVGIAYLAAIWVLIEVADTLVSIINAPTWIPQVLVYSAALGFPLTLILAWFYELTPEGIKATTDMEAVEAVKFMGRKLDFAIIGLLVVAVGFLVVANYVVEDVPSSFERSIAVLPFSNESEAEENAGFFANGVHDELLTQLAKIGSIKTISRTSVMEYRGSRKSMPEIGRELGVATLVEGRVRRAGDMVRVNVQLIDAETDEHLWADVYDREMTAENLFAMQREMATAIAGALQVTLTPEEATRLSEVPTTSTAAYEYFLSGNDYLRRDQDERVDFPLAVQLYESALEEDREFALAWAGLARAHALTYFMGVDQTESRREQARAAAERALELAPDLPRAHLAMGYYYYHGLGDYASALEEWAIAEQGMPGDAELYEARGYLYRRMGEMELAAANLNRAIELNPRRLDLLTTQEILYESLREYSRADQVLDRMLAIAPDNIWEPRRLTVRLFRGDITSVEVAREIVATKTRNPSLWLWLPALYERDYVAALELLGDWEEDARDGRAEYRPKATYFAITYQLAGMPDRAIPHLQSARTMIEQKMEVGSDDPRLLIALGEVLALLGEAGEATDLARQAMELAIDGANRPTFHMNAIMIFLAVGDYVSAIEELSAYLSAPGQWSIEGLLRDPRLDPIRDDPSFQVLVDQYRRQ